MSIFCEKIGEYHCLLYLRISTSPWRYHINCNNIDKMAQFYNVFPTRTQRVNFIKDIWSLLGKYNLLRKWKKITSVYHCYWKRFAPSDNTRGREKQVQIFWTVCFFELYRLLNAKLDCSVHIIAGSAVRNFHYQFIILERKGEAFFFVELFNSSYELK